MKTYLLAGLAAMAAALMVTPASAQFLTIDYTANLANSGAAAVAGNNATALDLNNGLIIASSSNATTPRLHFYNIADGTPATPAFLDYTWEAGEGTPGNLAGFSIGASNGSYYLYDQAADPFGNLQRVDGPTDTTAARVTTGTPVNFSRNIAVEGSGESTFFASTGRADQGPVDIMQASNAGVTAITHFGELNPAPDVDNPLNPLGGAGKADVAFSQVIDNNPPQYLATAEIANGGTDRVRLFELTGTYGQAGDMGYTIVASFLEDQGASAENQILGFGGVAIDLGDEDTFPVLFVLKRVSTTNVPGVAARLSMYRILSNGLLLEETIDIPQTAPINSALFDRGSLHIDRTNQRLYATWRSSTATQTNMAVISYVLPDVPTDATAWELYQ